MADVALESGAGRQGAVLEVMTAPPGVPGVPGASGKPPATTEDLARLVEENPGWLRGWLRGRLRDPEAADDICQEAFLKAFERLADLRDPSRFPAWLHRIAENALRDHLRAEARRKARILFTDQVEGLEVPKRESGRADAADLESEAESTEKVLQAIRSLPPKLRDPLLLRHSRNLPYREIGRILGIRENTVQVRIFRARKLLREKLKR